MENTQNPKLSPEEAREILWNEGDITYKLDDNQEELYNIYQNTDEKIIVWNMARGNGKSFLLCIIAVMECLKDPKALVKYACPKQKDARQIIQPIMRDIFEDCPKELRPEYIVSESAYKFPTGAQIQLSGLDNGRAESLRGGSCKLAIVDEAGTKSLARDLDYIIKSIMLPTVTRTKKINGKIILASTPPVSADHPWVKFLRKAELKGTATTRNIYTNPRMTEEMVYSIIEVSGGVESTAFRREYLCEIITDTENAIVPEFTNKIQELCIKEWKRPPFLDAYVAMDIGFKDYTVVLFAYYDFRAEKIIIEDEFAIRGQTTDTLAKGIKSKESSVFIDPYTKEIIPPYKRVSDNNLIVINDLYKLHDLIFQPTKKDDADAALNNMRILIAGQKIIINPRCQTLIRHLRDGIWNNNKTSFDRSADNGHYDAIDSLKYLVRNVDLFKNPYPSNYGFNKSEDYFEMRNGENNSVSSAIRKILNIKK